MSRLLIETGEALYGPRWQSEVARDLGCNVRTVQRWVAGVVDMPPGVYTDLWRIALERAQALDDLTDRLKVASTPSE